MNQVYETMTLASGEVLKKGQRVRLSDKFAEMFPEMKGNILPVKSHAFCVQKEFDFKLVQLQLNRQVLMPVNKVMSLIEDKIECFGIENNTIYCYTNYFKIDLEAAIITGEVVVINEDRVRNCNQASYETEPNVDSFIQNIYEAQ